MSLKRLERFLNHEDLDPDSVTRDPTQGELARFVFIQPAPSVRWVDDCTLISLLEIAVTIIILLFDGGSLFALRV